METYFSFTSLIPNKPAWIKCYFTYSALSRASASCEIKDQQLTVYRVSVPPRLLKSKSVAVKICSESKSHLSASCTEGGEWAWVCSSHRKNRKRKKKQKKQPWRCSCFPPNRRGQSYVYLGHIWQDQRGRKPGTDWCQLNLCYMRMHYAYKSSSWEGSWRSAGHLITGFGKPKCRI